MRGGLCSLKSVNLIHGPKLAEFESRAQGRVWAQRSVGTAASRELVSRLHGVRSWRSGPEVL